MALSDDYRPRLSIVLTEDQRKRLSKVLPWGTGRVLFSSIVDEVIELLEHHGMAAAGLLISKKASLLELMQMKEAGYAAAGPQVGYSGPQSTGSDRFDSSNKTEPKAKQKATRKGKGRKPNGVA